MLTLQDRRDIDDLYIRSDGPRIAGDPAHLPVLMLEFLGHLKATRSSRGPADLE